MSHSTRVRFGRIIGMLVALAVFGALPAVAMAQGTSPSSGGSVASGNTQTGTLTQSATAGAGGNAGNQGAIVQQNAGRDANASVNQTQNFSSGGVTGVGTLGTRYYSPRVYSRGYMTRAYPTRAYSAPTYTSPGVYSSRLAYTGFDAWIIAALGGMSVAGGLGLLALRRRAGLSS